MSSVMQTQGQAITSLNKMVHGIMYTMTGQMELSGLHEDLGLLMHERDYVTSQEEKKLINDNILTL